MIDLLLRIGLSNLCLSLALAAIAGGVHRGGKRPLLAHLLWLLVLVKLVTPPLFTIPVLELPGDTAPVAMAPLSAPGLAPTTAGSAGAAGALDASEGLAPLPSTFSLELGKTGLALLWLLGSALILTGSLVRIHRFGRLLAMASRSAPRELEELVAELSRRLGLKRIPALCVTSAHLSPMVWWTGGRVRVFLPAAALEGMEREELRWILAHELAHVRRRDHLVRWLEWLACVLFWWNPVAWWARRNLRAAEETCCDVLVLASLKPNPHTYASSLLSVVELLATPALRPPAMASEINSGGFLERRLNMIISKRPLPSTSRWLQAGVLALAVGLLPLGVAYAQEPDYEALGTRLVKAVYAGELSPSQAEAMIGALARERFVEQLRDSKEKHEPRDLEKLGQKLKLAVAAGKLSEEDARAKFEAWRKKTGEPEAEKRFTREDFARAEGKLKQAVQEGKLSGEDAKAKFEAWRKRTGEPDAEKRFTREDFARAEGKLKQAVQEGKLSGEDARAKLRTMREWIAASAERGTEPRDWGAIRRRVGRAVESGDMTREEAGELVRKLRDGEENRVELRQRRQKYADIEKRIQAAVEGGELSEKEAKKKLIALREEMFPSRGERTITIEKYKRAAAELKRAVDNGRVKAEEAEQRLIEMRKRIADTPEEPHERRLR